MNVMAQGAEAVLYFTNRNTVVKERPKKNYRIETIDENIRKKRTLLEARLMREARRAGVLTPQILREDKYSIEMEFIDGQKVKEILDQQDVEEICQKIGESVGKLHSFDVIHGDLTTSNMIWKSNSLYFIDFGLGFQSQRIEDKAVDLHLLNQAIDATHFEIAENARQIILKAYQNNCSVADKVISTILEIEKRGRYAKRNNIER